MIMGCLLPGRIWPAGPAEADQAAGDPGTAADPLLSVSSLQQHLNQLFAAQSRQLDTLENRLDQVSSELQALQDKAGPPFPDLKDHWAAGAVLTMKNRGIISGYPDGKFHPEDPVTRAAMAAMLARAKNLEPDPGAAGFKDVPSGHWAAGPIGAVRAAGYMQGYPDGSLRPERGVNRAEAAAMLDKAFTPSGSATAGFKDIDDSYWAAAAIRRMAGAGIISGYPDGTFRPDRVMSRAEAAAMLANVLPSSQ
jgi:hypothetical protein